MGTTRHQAKDQNDRILSVLDEIGVPFLLGTSLVVALWFLVLKPIPHGRCNDLGLRVTIVMAGIWYLYRWKYHWLKKAKWTLAIGLTVGLCIAIHRLYTINPDAEVIHVYRSLFDVISNGQNPYSCLCIFHRTELDMVKLGNFNYPPMEIWPYWLVYKVVRTWNSTVFSATLLIMQIGVCVILCKTFPKMKLIHLAAFFPAIVLLELYTNVATSFLFLALILLVIITEQTAPKRIHRYLLWVLFGMGLLTKFILIPIFVTYYWHKLKFRDRSSYLEFIGSIAVVLIVSMVLMAPFGIVNVFKSTVLFNLCLDVRASLTTYYPNVLSGLFYWLSVEGAYPIAAVFILGVSIFVAHKLKIFSALLLVSITFIMIAPTPEPQYFPVILYIAIVGRFFEWERTAS